MTTNQKPQDEATALRFRKKPVVITARQATDREEIATLEGTMVADPGDWIITGVKGETYPCKPDIFAMTYEPADDLAAIVASVELPEQECSRCRGTGRVPSRCPDPQCGDSTWDHECELGGTDPCPKCAPSPAEK